MRDRLRIMFIPFLKEPQTKPVYEFAGDQMHQVDFNSYNECLIFMSHILRYANTSPLLNSWDVIIFETIFLTQPLSIQVWKVWMTNGFDQLGNWFTM